MMFFLVVDVFLNTRNMRPADCERPVIVLPSERGLLAAVGAASEFDEWATSIEEVVSMRSSANERDIELD